MEETTVDAVTRASECGYFDELVERIESERGEAVRNRIGVELLREAIAELLDVGTEVVDAEVAAVLAETRARWRMERRG